MWYDLVRNIAGFRPGVKKVPDPAGWIDLGTLAPSPDTDGLAEADYDFVPGEGCNSLRWMVRHVWGLTNWIHIRIEGHPFWHIINGPLCDALTHVGQIRYLRRLLGKQGPEANVFLGRPPEAQQE